MSLLNSAPRDLSDVDAASRSPARASKWGSDAQPSPCPTRTIGAQNTSAREPHGAEEAKLEAEPVSRGDVADRDDPDESEEEKRNRRMASNRESARRSRQRKLARVAELQDRYAALWSDRAQTVHNIQLMESLVQRVRHENLRLDVDAGRVARRIVAARGDASAVAHPALAVAPRGTATVSATMRGEDRARAPWGATRETSRTGATNAPSGATEPGRPAEAEAEAEAETLLDVFASAAA